jgi:hypothetical protein
VPTPSLWRHVLTPLVLLTTLSLGACKWDAVLIDENGKPIDTGTHLSVVSDPAKLAADVQALNTLVPVATSIAGSGALASRIPLPTTAQAAMAASVPYLTLVAQVTPPTVNGSLVEATHVAFSGNLAYVSYGTRGQSQGGAVDVFDVSNPAVPQLISQGLFARTDVTALTVGNGSLYMAEGTDDLGFSDRAVVEKVTLDAAGKLTTTSTRVSVPSYIATGIDYISGIVLVTSGSGGPRTGGFSALDGSTLASLYQDPFLDARDVTVSAAGTEAIVVQGTPGRLRRYTTTKTGGSFTGSSAVGGLSIPESKSSIASGANFVAVALGDGGTAILDPSSYAKIETVPLPVVAGVLTPDAVTNSVTASYRALFMANGGAGVFVANIAYKLSTTSTNVTVVGQLQFPGRVSANYVASNGRNVFVADGLGGLKILQLPPCLVLLSCVEK